MKTNHFILAAIFGVALALTFSCSSGDGGNPSGGDNHNGGGDYNGSDDVFVSCKFDDDDCYDESYEITYNECLSNGGTVVESCPINTPSSSSIKSSSSITPSSSSSSYSLPSSSSVATSGTFTDIRDNKVYKWVKIGTQIWMAENMNYYDNYSGARGRCYNDKPENCTTYGRLYNIQEAREGGVCPSGWRLSSSGDWNTLIDFVGGREIAPTKLKANSDLWITKAGTDDYGFSALPSGYISNPNNYDIGETGRWWTSSLDIDRTTPFSVSIYYLSASQKDHISVSSQNGANQYYSVRCVYSGSGNPENVNNTPSSSSTTTPSSSSTATSSSSVGVSSSSSTTTSSSSVGVSSSSSSKATNGSVDCNGYCKWDTGCVRISTDPTGEYGSVVSTCDAAISNCQTYSPSKQIFSNDACNGSTTTPSSSLH